MIEEIDAMTIKIESLPHICRLCKEDIIISCHGDGYCGGGYWQIVHRLSGSSLPIHGIAPIHRDLMPL